MIWLSSCRFYPLNLNCLYCRKAVFIRRIWYEMFGSSILQFFIRAVTALEKNTLAYTLTWIRARKRKTPTTLQICALACSIPIQRPCLLKEKFHFFNCFKRRFRNNRKHTVLFLVRQRAWFHFLYTTCMAFGVLESI